MNKVIYMKALQGLTLLIGVRAGFWWKLLLLDFLLEFCGLLRVDMCILYTLSVCVCVCVRACVCQCMKLEVICVGICALELHAELH
jgi:hypothetical protein